MPCPHCGQTHPPAIRFCPNTGLPLVPPKPPRRWGRWLLGTALLVGVGLLVGIGIWLLYGGDLGPQLHGLFDMPVLPAAANSTPRPTRTRPIPTATPLEPTSTPSPLPTATPLPSATRTATSTPTPTLTPMPQPSSVIAYSIGSGAESRIVLVAPDGSGRRLLPNQPAGSSIPSFSPDGMRLAFVSTASGREQIYVISLDGTGLAQLTSDATNYSPAWSPDGARLAFVSERDGNAEIYIMDADGGRQQRLTFFAGADYDPAWSPDGRQIAFERSQGNRRDVFIMNADGSNVRQLTHDGDSNTTPAWSPDGGRIAFERKSGSQWAIYVMNADGSNPQPLTPFGGINYRPAWSPDGTQIAWRSNRSGSEEIWVMNADSSGARQLTAEGGAYDPAWGRVTQAGPAATWQPCPDARPSRLRPGSAAYVSFDPPLRNRVRAEPNTGARLLGVIEPGEQVDILDGPRCSERWVWWRVRSREQNLAGWTPEGDQHDYWLVPLP